MNPNERKRDFIQSLDIGQRDLYAEMIMRSLRGSWRKPRPRAEILWTIGDVGGLLVYDDEKMKNRTETYLERGGKRGHWDGRFFRSTYGDVDISTFEESTVRELSAHIPNDMTWDDHRISKEFEETND